MPKPSGKISLEPGEFNWAGGVYAAPRPRGGVQTGLPPGWYSAPGSPEDLAAPAQAMEPDQSAIEPVHRPPPEDIRGAARETMESMVMAAVEQVLGTEYVALSDGTAEFMGHHIKLSDDGISAIKTLLGMEVCRKLEQEKERVLARVLNEELQTGDGREPENVPDVPGAAEAVVTKESEGIQQVQRVRIKGTATKAKNVRHVPSAEESAAGTGDGT